MYNEARGVASIGRIEFIYKGKKLKFPSNSDKSSFRNCYLEIYNWLFDNNYDFKNVKNVYNNNGNFYTISDVDRIIKIGKYQRRLFQKLKNSDKYILVAGNKSQYKENLNNMLRDFGITGEIKFDDFDRTDIDDFGEENVEVKPFSRFNKIDEIPSVKYYLLGAYDSSVPDLCKQYVESGCWINGFADDTDNFKLKDEVNQIPIGANVAIKSSYVKGKVNPVIMIKARGVVTKNYGDGAKIDVDWEKDFKPFEIQRNDVGGYRQTLHEISNKPEHIDLIFNESNIENQDDYIEKFSKRFRIPIDFKASQSQEEKETKEYVKNPFRQAICVLGKSGKGKSTTIEKILKSFGEKMDYEFIIPTASTTNLLSQYSPGSNRYIQSRLGKLIMEAKRNPNKLFTAVFDECHKANVIEMINDELLQSISLYRNLEKRFISVDDDTAILYKGLDNDRGNLLIPNNFGFIFLSSKPNIIIDNADFFNRVDIYVLENQPDKDAVDLYTVIGSSITLSSKYFRSIGDKKTGSKTDSDIDLIKELHK